MKSLTFLGIFDQPRKNVEPEAYFAHHHPIGNQYNHGPSIIKWEHLIINLLSYPRKSDKMLRKYASNIDLIIQ